MMLRVLIALALALSCSAAPAFDYAPVSTQIADAIADVIGASDHPQRILVVAAVPALQSPLMRLLQQPCPVFSSDAMPGQQYLVPTSSLETLPGSTQLARAPASTARRRGGAGVAC